MAAIHTMKAYGSYTYNEGLWQLYIQFMYTHSIHVCMYTDSLHTCVFTKEGIIINNYFEGFLIPYKSLDWSTLWTCSIVGVVIVGACSLPQLLIMRSVHKVCGLVISVCPSVCKLLLYHYCRILLPSFILLLMISNNPKVIVSKVHSFDARSIIIATLMWSIIMVCIMIDMERVCMLYMSYVTSSVKTLHVRVQILTYFWNS